MVLTPRPKRRQPTGCSVLLVVVPLTGIAYALNAPVSLLAFDLIEATYWLAVIGGAICGMMGNKAAWPLVASAYVAAGLDWADVEFTPLRWVAIDLAAAAGIVGLRWWERANRAPTHDWVGKFADPRCLKATHVSYLLHWTDWLILALFLPAWVLYDRPDYFRYLGTAALVIAQMGLTLPVALARMKTAENRSRVAP